MRRALAVPPKTILNTTMREVSRIAPSVAPDRAARSLDVATS
jgi:hypothetical protein